MPKVTKESIPLHIVVPDTNILWDEDKSKVVNQNFNDFWKRNLKLIQMKLILPEVVLGELSFQQATSALKASKTILDNTKRLSAITHSKYSISHSDEKIKKQIEDKINKWLKSLSGKIEQTPINFIKWNEIVQNAIWRISPFIFDSSDKDNEKGFRDSIILETLKYICNKSYTQPVNIVFITDDYVLKTAAEEHLKNDKKVIIFESLVNFESYIKLTQEELTNKFVKSIQSHAQLKFFDPNDKSCVYYKNNVSNLIIEKFKNNLISPSEQNTLKGLLGLAINKQYGIKKEKWWISQTNFETLHSLREYHWKTQVTLARLFRTNEENLKTSLTLLANQFSEIQLINFNVKWKADVKTDGRFLNIKVLDVELTEDKREIATEDMINRWGLQIN